MIVVCYNVNQSFFSPLQTSIYSWEESRRACTLISPL